MSTYTGLQLRDGVNSSGDLTGTVSFSLPNTLSSTLYFVIKGNRVGPIENQTYTPIFSSASISNLTNCKVVTGSVHAVFIIEPNSTATFDMEVQGTIPAAQVKFQATNPLVYNINDRTSSGSVAGITEMSDTDTPPRPPIPTGSDPVPSDGWIFVRTQDDRNYFDLTNQAGTVIEIQTPERELLTQDGIFLTYQDANFIITQQPETTTVDNKIVKQDLEAILLQDGSYLLLQRA